jgi:hypothetical protein
MLLLGEIRVKRGSLVSCCGKLPTSGALSAGLSLYVYSTSFCSFFNKLQHRIKKNRGMPVWGANLTGVKGRGAWQYRARKCEMFCVAVAEKSRKADDNRVDNSLTGYSWVPKTLEIINSLVYISGSGDCQLMNCLTTRRKSP